MCSFNLRLFTRERLPPQASTAAHPPTATADHSEVSQDTSDSGEAGKRSLAADGKVDGLLVPRPTCSRVLRVERLTHTIMTCPGWRTLLITWNDHMQSWVKTGAICLSFVSLHIAGFKGAMPPKFFLSFSYKKWQHRERITVRISPKYFQLLSTISPEYKDETTVKTMRLFPQFFRM